MTGRRPRSKLYDGALYGRLMDPLLADVHRWVARRLPDGERVLDACCGTGDLARQLAASGRRVVGLDLSPRNIAYAAARTQGTDPARLRFEVADVAHAPLPAEGRYDVASVVLSLHEMPADCRAPVLRRLATVARRVLIVDFAAPMPWNVAGLRNRTFELLAGPEHFTAFRDFSRRGGLRPLIADAGLRTEWERPLDARTLHAVAVSQQ